MSPFHYRRRPEKDIEGSSSDAARTMQGKTRVRDRALDRRLSVVDAGRRGRSGGGSDDPAEGTGGYESRPAGRREPPHRTMKRFEIGVGPRSYWLFEPAEPKPRGAQWPVVVFLHGWFAVNPGFYGSAWIDHLVRNGRIVIFPRYQNDVGTMPQDFLPNAVAAIHDALGVLHDGVGHVRWADRLGGFVLIGHSAGAIWRAQIAAAASDPHADLPQPQARHRHDAG